MANANIEHWQCIIDRNLHGPEHANARERLRYYLGSLMLGRDWMEDTEHYFDRSGHREFVDWARATLGIAK